MQIRLMSRHTLNTEDMRWTDVLTFLSLLVKGTECGIYTSKAHPGLLSMGNFLRLQHFQQFADILDKKLQVESSQYGYNNPGEEGHPAWIGIFSHDFA